MPDFKEAKEKLIKIQEQISDLERKETQAKIDFLKTVPLGEEFYNSDGDKYTFVGFQTRPEPVALAEWPGGVHPLELKYMDEIFLTMEDFNPSNYRELAVDNKENTEDTYPCIGCGVEIPATEPYCKDCDKDFEAKKAA